MRLKMNDCICQTTTDEERVACNLYIHTLVIISNLVISKNYTIKQSLSTLFRLLKVRRYRAVETELHINEYRDTVTNKQYFK